MQLCLGFANAPALAQAVPAALTPEESNGNLKPHIRFTTGAPMDALRELPPEIVADLGPIEHASIQFGQVGETVIATVPLRNVSDRRGEWILNTGRGALRDFRLYVQQDDGLELLIDNRNSAQVEDVLARFHAFATEFSLEPGEEKTFVIQFEDTASSYMPLEVVSRGDFFADRRANVALVSAVVAGSLILIFFNVLMFAITGKREFAWLGAAEIAFTLNTLHAEGYTTIFLLYDAPSWQAYLGDMLRVSFSALMAQFGRVFLQSDIRFPRLDIALRAAVWSGWTIFALALLAVFVPVLPGDPIHLLGWLHTACVAIVLPALAWLAIRNLSAIYWPLLISWTSVGIYIVYMAIGVSGIAPQLPLPWHWVGPVGLFECIMATLALGLHLRQLHFERIASEIKAKDALLEKLALTTEAARLAEDRARAMAAVQSRDRLIESSGHDTRHVLHALNSAIHFSRRKAKKEDPANDLTGLIEASARHLDDIVATSVGVGNKATPFMALGLVNAARIFSDIEAIYTVPALESHAIIRWKADGKCMVITDEALVARAVSNLVNNAIKFSDGGLIALECLCEDDHFTISVSDSGAGMPAAVIDELRSEIRDPEDSQLGTGWRAIREVMVLLGGEFTVDSDRTGTRISFRIPDPLGGRDSRPVEFEELQDLAPHLSFFDGDAMSRKELMEKLDTLPADAIPVLVTSQSNSNERMWAANNFVLMLTRPLCEEAIAHRHIRHLHSNPTDRARSTS